MVFDGATAVAGVDFILNFFLRFKKKNNFFEKVLPFEIFYNFSKIFEKFLVFLKSFAIFEKKSIFFGIFLDF